MSEDLVGVTKNVPHRSTEHESDPQFCKVLECLLEGGRWTVIEKSFETIQKRRVFAPNAGIVTSLDDHPVASIATEVRHGISAGPYNDGTI